MKCYCSFCKNELEYCNPYIIDIFSCNKCIVSYLIEGNPYSNCNQIKEIFVQFNKNNKLQKFSLNCLHLGVIHMTYFPIDKKVCFVSKDCLHGIRMENIDISSIQDAKNVLKRFLSLRLFM
jgi:hypothetical protein